MPARREKEPVVEFVYHEPLDHLAIGRKDIGQRAVVERLLHLERGEASTALENKAVRAHLDAAVITGRITKKEVQLAGGPLNPAALRRIAQRLLEKGHASGDHEVLLPKGRVRMRAGPLKDLLSVGGAHAAFDRTGVKPGRAPSADLAAFERVADEIKLRRLGERMYERPSED
jgi:hypothetical protein